MEAFCLAISFFCLSGVFLIGSHLYLHGPCLPTSHLPHLLTPCLLPRSRKWRTPRGYQASFQEFLPFPSHSAPFNTRFQIISFLKKLVPPPGAQMKEQRAKIKPPDGKNSAPTVQGSLSLQKEDPGRSGAAPIPTHLQTCSTH